VSARAETQEEVVKRVLSLISLFAMAALLAVTSSFAQNPTGKLTGTVVDQQSAAIVGASVEVKDNATGKIYTTSAGADGQFQVADLAPGSYTVTVTQQGFKKGVFSDIKITVDKTYDLPAKLEVGEVVDTITVEGGGAQIIETQNTSVSNVVSGKAITNLPFNSRSAVLLGVLDPGAQTVGGSRNSTFEGLPKGSINITFDGINVQDNLLKSNDGFFANNDPRIDDVDEFSITDAGNSVDKAGEGAVQMNYVSKRGGNDWHGGVWYQTRNTAFDSNYYFNKEAGLPRQTIQMHDYGYKLGGPVLKNKLFFFTDFDFFHLPQSVARSRTILTPQAAGGTFTYVPTTQPTAAQLAADPWLTCNAAANTCAVNVLQMAAAKGFTSSFDPTVSSILNAVESAAAAPGVTVSSAPPSLWQNTINFNASSLSNRKYPDLRLDYTLSPKHSLEFDYHYAHYNAGPDLLNNRDATYPVAPFNANIGAQLSNRNLLALAWRWAISSNMSNEARVGTQLVPTNFGLGISTANFYPTIGTNFGNVTYRFGLTGVSAPFQSPGATQGRNSAVGEILDNFSWTKGTHNLSFGYAQTIIHYNDFLTQSAIATFGVTTDDPADTALFSAANVPGIGSTDRNNAEGLYASLTGRLSSFTNAIAFDPTTGNFRVGAPQRDRFNQNEVGVYAADSWRLRPTLTVNYGLRWQYDGPPTDKLNEYFMLSTGYAGLFGVSGQGNLFKPGTLTGSVPTFVNDAGKEWWNKYWKAFAPNVGFAWQPNIDNRIWKSVFGGPGQTVIRSSYSIAYDREGLNNFISIAGGNPGFLGQQFSNASTANSSTDGTFTAGSVLLRSGALNFVAQNPTTFSSSFPLTASSGNAVNAFNPDLRPGMVQSWTFGVQRELGKNQALEVRYVGNHGTGLWRQYSLNEINIFENGFLTEFNNATNNLNICKATASCTGSPSFANLGLPGQVAVPILTGAFTGSKTGSQTNASFKNGTFITDLGQGLVGSFANSLNSSIGNWQNLVAAGFPSNFWVVNPDARGGAFPMDNANQSTYNALVVDFRRRQAKGLYFDVSYVYSKSLTNNNANSSADFANFTTLRNRGYDKGPAPFDTRNAVKGQLLYELPFGPGKRWTTSSAFANRLIGGWNINSITRWQTGSPINITSGLGSTFSSNCEANATTGAPCNTVLDPGVNLVGITASQLQSLLTTNKSEAPGTVFYVPTTLLDAKLQRANTAIIQPCATPGALCQRLFVYGPQFFRSDISLVKETKITERVSLELRAEALNAFNDTNFYYACGSGTSPCSVSTQSTRFGQMGSNSTNGAYQDFNTTQDPGGRILQLVGRINF
jgi:hypothetical protein